MLKTGAFIYLPVHMFAALRIAIVLAVCSLLVSWPEALAQGVNDALTPIMDSTENDPAGAQLMIMCIGLLVTLVLSIFAGTMYYMVRAKKKPATRNGAPVPKDDID